MSFKNPATIVKVAYTEIHWDFILDKSNLSDLELQTRFAVAGGRQIFSKDVPSVEEANGMELVAPPVPGLPVGLSMLQDFKHRLNDFRQCLMDLAVPRMKEAFRLRAATVNHNFTDCSSLEDFVMAYRNRPYDNKMRRMVNLLCHEMWGKECMGQIEKHVMKKLKLTYKNALVSGEVVKTRRLYGSIRKMFVRMKQTLFVDVFRHTGLDRYQEVVYKRYLKKPMDGVATVVKVTEASHGYDGFLGLGMSHPSLLNTQTLPLPEPNSVSEVSENTELSLLEYMKKEAESGSGKTPSEILAVWTVNKRPPEVTITTAAESLSACTNSDTMVS